MRKIILTSIMSLFSIGVFSQIRKVELAPSEVIGELKPMGTTLMKLEKIEDTYIMSYKDLTYQHLTDYKSFSFKDIDNAFENLYAMIIEGLDNPPKESVMIELPEVYLFLTFGRFLGLSSVHFSIHNKNGITKSKTMTLTRKQVNKLFGKESD